MNKIGRRVRREKEGGEKRGKERTRRREEEGGRMKINAERC